MSEYIHIVSLTAPSPPDYGGAFDLFYKIPALAGLGRKVILHYFDYKPNRGHLGLEPHCVEINKYKRTGFLRSLLSLKPYIVSSRTESLLIKRLQEDSHPVLLEGIHCAGLIPYLNDRKVLVRVHNDEARYYRELQHNERNWWKAAYFFYEGLLLSHFQKGLSTEPEFLFVSETDKERFKLKYSQHNQSFLPCFIPWQSVRSLTGKGEYCLYHGNLSISENVSAALWLVQSVLPSINLPLVIAGRSAADLGGKLSGNSKVTLVSDPTDEELAELIRGAHINVLPSFNNTGVKLKLIHALYEGRFCLTNEAGVSGSGLGDAVTVAETASDWIKAVKEVTQSTFTEQMIEKRKGQLALYNNKANALKLTELL